MLSDAEFYRRRAYALRQILESDAPRKLIVAGPGTGKTYTFQQVLTAIGERGLAMTFLLGLVRDLEDAIGADTDVYSFHGFARRLLHQLDGTGVSRGGSLLSAVDAFASRRPSDRRWRNRRCAQPGRAIPKSRRGRPVPGQSNVQRFLLRRRQL